MEDKIQEIMEMVTQHAYIYYSAAIGGCRDEDDVKESECVIESKLRELVERCSVREPLSDEAKKKLLCEWSYSQFTGKGDFLDGVEAAESAHNITNTTKE